MNRTLLFGLLSLILTTVLFPSQALADHADAAKDAIARAEGFVTRAAECLEQAKKHHEHGQVKEAIALREKARNNLGLARDALRRAGREVELMKKFDEQGAKILQATIERMWQHVYELASRASAIK